MTFGEKLQSLRQRAGMSQDALAERLHATVIIGCMRGNVQDAGELPEALARLSESMQHLDKIAAKAGSNGKLFGSVTSKEISDALHEQFDLTIEKQKIVQAEPIKSFGAYEVKCKLGYEVTGTIHVLVIEEK